MKKAKYKCVVPSPNNNRLFEDEDGRVYIVDHSGSNPTMTDDGPLLFDHQDCKEIKLEQRGDSLYANVPVLMERKSFFDAVAHVDTAAALYLGRKYGITVTHSTVLHKA
jgi:hypothetical protein